MTEDEYLKVIQYLKRISGILATGDFQIQQNTKNKEFDRQYSLRDSEKKAILRSLEAEDCIGIGPNDNPRYPDAEVYKFIKECNLLVYGEETNVKLYIKTYLVEGKHRDIVIVISFHEEGMF